MVSLLCGGRALVSHSSGVESPEAANEGDEVGSSNSV